MMENDGMMSENDFLVALDHFLRISSKLHDTWRVENISRNHLKDTYLKRKTGKWMRVSSASKKEQIEEFDKSTNSEVCVTEERDPMELELENCYKTSGTDVKDMVFCQLEHSILYSHSFSVPVIFFNVFLPGGELLTLDDLWENSLSQVSHRQDNWSFITQQEHPLLRRPFFHFHPCHTAEFMKEALCSRLSTSPVTYLLIWLSSIAPFVHLDLSLQYAKEISETVGH